MVFLFMHPLRNCIVIIFRLHNGNKFRGNTFVCLVSISDVSNSQIKLLLNAYWEKSKTIKLKFLYAFVIIRVEDELQILSGWMDAIKAIQKKLGKKVYRKTA